MKVSVEHITAGYGDGFAVVKDVSLTVPEGCVTTLLGPNGCGKSTLLKAMSRLLPPVGGCVLYDEFDIRSRSACEAAQTVALLPQNPICPPGLTVGELVERGRHPYRRRIWGTALASDKEAIRKALEQTDTLALVGRDVTELSGGQRQRVWLAMILAQDTPVILLDEPTTFLDPAHAIELLMLVRQLAARGKTIVMVLHDLMLAGMFSDHVAVMKDGRLIAGGTPREALTEEVLFETYGLRAEVWEDVQSAAPIIVPRSVM